MKVLRLTGADLENLSGDLTHAVEASSAEMAGLIDDIKGHTGQPIIDALDRAIEVVDKADQPFNYIIIKVVP